MGEIKGIWKKLVKARMAVQESDIKMSGNNTYSNYKYFELADIMPAINKANAENGIISLFNLVEEATGQIAVLELIDIDDGTSIIFKSKTSECIMKTKEGRVNPIQELGATHTYMRRYMYLGAYEIAEADSVNSLPPATFGNPPKNPVKLASQSQLSKIFTTAGELKIGKSDLECAVFKDYNVKSMKDLTIIQANNIIENIKNIADAIEKRKSECIKAITALEADEELMTIMERDNIKNLPDSTFTACKKVYKELKTIKEQQQKEKDKENKTEEETKGEEGQQEN
ncbi:ERF family protein [Fusobacterium varium]|uniref:ERF family protein n=1 Tax=Fusobacterium varium TaxID=856 RepID=UPI00241DB619|nr:ERF family protein [Fusobacterium varium]